MVILIADDDRLARYMLKSMLNEYKYESLIIYEVSSGKRLVEQCKLYQPDIAFVDINMPHLDGLSAISECKQYSADTQFVVVTGYSDFDYARKSIQLQVTDYLVKPIEQEQMDRVMEKIAEQLRCSRHHKHLSFRTQVSQCFDMWDQVGYCPQKDPCVNLPGQYYAFHFYLDTALSPEIYKSGYLALSEQFLGLGKRLTLQKVPYMLWESIDNGMVFIIRCIDSMLPTIQRYVGQMLQLTARPNLDVSCVYVSGIDLWSLYKEIKKESSMEELRFGVPDGTACNARDLRFTPHEQELLKAACALMDAYQQANESDYAKYLQRIREVPQNAVHPTIFSRLTKLLGITMNIDLSRCRNLHELYVQLEMHKAKLYSSGLPEGEDKFTEITKYIDEHYMEDLSVAQLSEKIGLTPNYFSKIFHDRMGKTFSAYLTEVRVAQAKRILLVRKDVKIKDVALMVGYFSSRYFTNVFRKITGYYPSDFREKRAERAEE